MSKEEFGTEEERARVILDIEKWAESHHNPDSAVIAIMLMNNAKTFTPYELLVDIREETALGVVLLDIIISESEKAGIAPIDYVKRMSKILRKAPGEFIKTPFFEDEVN